MKRLKNIKGKNEERLDVIKDQGKKQLNAIKDQGENQLKATKKDNNTKNTVYLTKTMYELFKTYPKSFNKTSMREKNEGKTQGKE